MIGEIEKIERASQEQGSTMVFKLSEMIHERMHRSTVIVAP